MNRIILLGRLVRDPEVKVTSTQKTYCTFTLAVDRPFIAKSGQREADFIPIQTWNKTAEICGNSLSKGQRLLVEGRLQIRSYDGKDGNKHYVTEVIADRVEFIEKRNSSGAQTEAPKADAGPMGSFGSEVTFNEEVPF
ncbi:single-stranded DNA-binding protein [uncultured Acidaminococcus sp.]|uniref:single-stranded DNA-binding protein n=1 Tax=uncultured Acidaminococcus sp. TaxID=352152 RepID=UPI002594478E|nr:single-stranded DNA-binding protein [uncultured Acidaminococcus sp.]